MLVRGRLRQGPAWLDSIVGQIVEEAAREEPGFQAIIERFAAIIFVNAVRASIADDPATRELAEGIERSAHRAGADPCSRERGAAVGCGRIGEGSGVFFHRFRATVGSTVMDYVGERRMELAATLLSGSHKPLAEIALDVGYDSEISFGQAFRRWAETPPGRYRRKVRSADGLGQQVPRSSLESIEPAWPASDDKLAFEKAQTFDKRAGRPTSRGQG